MTKANSSARVSNALPNEPENGTAAGSFALYGGQALWFPVIALVGFGILFVYSASSVYSAQKYKDEFIFVKKQALYLIPGLFMIFLGLKTPLRIIDRFAGRLFLLCLTLTFLTKVPGIGRKVLGASRWIGLGPLQLQPSEFLKVASVLFASRLLAESPHQLHRLWPTLLCYVALLLQPDFGSSVILSLGLAGLILIHGIPKRVFAGAILSILPVAIIVMVAAPYRMRRLVTFLDPFADPLGAGFQVIQSFVAIATGGIFGKGLGASQQKLFFLPEAHTDFILAVIGEEMGFAGILIISLIYGLFFFCLLQIMRNAANHRERLLATGFFSMFAGSTLINMGVVAGLLPTKGLALPFISSGGSSLLASLFMVGILGQIHKNGLLCDNESGPLPPVAESASAAILRSQNQSKIR